jgi:hypothetical protein
MSSLESAEARPMHMSRPGFRSRATMYSREERNVHRGYLNYIVSIYPTDLARSDSHISAPSDCSEWASGKQASDLGKCNVFFKQLTIFVLLCFRDGLNLKLSPKYPPTCPGSDSTGQDNRNSRDWLCAVSCEN